jgi:hypothetical protein
MFYRVLIEPQTESAGLLQSSRSHSEAATIIECVIENKKPSEPTGFDGFLFYDR